MSFLCGLGGKVDVASFFLFPPDWGRVYRPPVLVTSSLALIRQKNNGVKT